MAPKQETVYVVRGSTGEYSDRSEWLVRAFINEDAAKDYAERCGQHARAFAERERIAGTYIDSDGQNPLDSNFHCDYTGTYYTVEACPLGSA